MSVMTEDRLAEIEQLYTSGYWGASDDAYEDIQWLIAEVKRLRALAEQFVRSEYEGTSSLQGYLDKIYG